MKYIIDTDIGDDIDDALALDIALKKGMDIIGVTTVYKNTVARARIAKKLLTLYGRGDIPVLSGYGGTLNGCINQTELPCQYTPDLDGAEYAQQTSPPAAIDFIIESAQKYGKELTVIAIGPLTNIATAINKNAAAMRGIGKFLMMGGDYANQYSEWNILCDVEAAKIVYEANLPMLCFGHELTSRTEITREQQAELFAFDGSPYNRYLAELSRLWYKSKNEGHLIILHDVLTVYYDCDKQFFQTKQAPVKVETLGEMTRGMTVNLSVMCHYNMSKANKVEYALCDNAEDFAEMYFKIMKGESL